MAIGEIVEWGKSRITEARVVLVITPSSVVNAVQRSAGRHPGHLQPRHIGRDGAARRVGTFQPLRGKHRCTGAIAG